MGGERLEIGVQFRKFLIFSIRTFCRSVLNHPFLVCLVLFLLFMYKSFPFLFSLFLSASPVLVCTAVLLGTLLSFGQPNIPEIEKEEKTTHEIATLKTGIQKDETVVERHESFFVERQTVKRSDVEDRSIEEASSTAADVVTEVEKDGGCLVDSAPLIEENSREIHSDKQVTDEGEERELQEPGFETKGEINEVKLGDAVFLENQYSRIEMVEDENVELQHDKSPVESIDSSMADRADTSPISPWKPVEEEEEGVDDEASDSGSDRAESSSPDASMADIIPMLDELHPLLDEDTPQPAHLSHDGSDAGSERSQKSSDGTNDSDEDSENPEEEVGDDDHDDDEEEEETLGGGGKDDAIKSAIKWTEDDQKNLMDLGTSELERNQRLENLIARRRARRMMTEKNLIDLDSADLPFNIAPISTSRHNPFDLPYNSIDNIPGSAPSILLPRRNPFDIPYDSSEEKPDLKGDGFQQEFMPFAPSKEMFFRRHESFNVGPSFFGIHKHEKQDSKLKPLFVPERLGSEGTSYFSFQRQSSDLSDSKVSSVPETESVCSAGDHDDKKLIEEEFSQHAELISDVEHPSEHVRHGSSVPETESVCSAGEHDDKKLIEEEFSQHAELISDVELPSEHVGHGSESSEDVDIVELGQGEMRGFEHDEVEIQLGDEETHPEMVSSFSETRDDVATPGGHNTRAEEVNYSSRSSSSSSSEVHERIFDDKEDEVQPTEENVIEDSGLSTQPSSEESDVNTKMELVIDSQHKEPVYDSSPPAVQKTPSSSSISSDLQVETSEMCFVPVVVKRTVSFTERESEVTDQSIGADAPSNEQILAGSSQIDSVDNNETMTSEVVETAEHILLNHELSGVDPKLDNSANESVVSEFVAEHAPIISKPSSEPSSEEDHRIYQDGNHQHEQEQDTSSRVGASIDVVVHEVVSEDKSSQDLNLTASDAEQTSEVIFEQVSGSPVASSSESEAIEEHPLDKEVVPQIKKDQDQVHLSCSDENLHVANDQEPREELLPAHSECVSEEKPMYKLEEQLPMSDKAMVESSSKNHEKLVEPSIIQMESVAEVNATSKSYASEFQPKTEESANIYSHLTPDSTSFPSEVSLARSPTALADLKYDALDRVVNPAHDHIPLQSFNFPTETTVPQVEHDIIEEADEIKEIDEGLLMELDAVGDFSVKEFGSNLNKIEHNQVYGEEMNPEMPIVEAQMVEDIESISEKTRPMSVKTVEIGEVEIPQHSQIKEEINSEAWSLEDMDTAIRQISEEEIKMPVIVESAHAELIPQEAKAGCSEYEISHKDSSLTETKVELPVVEARSLEDIDTAFTQISEQEIKMPVVVETSDAELIPQESKAGCSEYEISREDSSLTETKVELPVVEARSIEDIDLAFKLLHNVESNNSTSSIEGRPDVAESIEAGEIDSDVHMENQINPSPLDERPEVVESKNTSETPSDLSFSEARSLQDTDMALKLASKGDVDVPMKSDSIAGSVESESNEVGSSKEIESSIKEPSIPETITRIAEQPDHGAQASDDLSSSISDGKGKTRKSGKSSSSASSSSSSSDSE